MLNPEFKTAWVAALRSGKYQQAKSKLNNGKGGFCCLGVAADIKGAKWEPALPFSPSTLIAVLNGKAISSPNGDGFLSPSFLEEIGLTDIKQRKLADMNDSGQSFAMIADEIETTL